MADKYLGKYRNETVRLKNYDYGSNVLYHITINTHLNREYFGDIGFVRTDDCPSTIKNEIIIRTDNRPSLQPTEIGKIADEYWREIPKHYPWVELDAYQLIPNHLHGILLFDKPDVEHYNLSHLTAEESS